MRKLLIAVLGLALPACSHVKDARNQATEPAGWCKKLPYPLEASYADGGTMMRARRIELEREVVEWSYFDHSGKLILLEEDIPKEETFFTAFYPEGQKQFEGGYIYTPEGYLAQGTWSFYHPNGKLAARAQLHRGALRDEAQWDAKGNVVAWSMDPALFQMRPLRSVTAVVPAYPEVALENGVQGSSCSLVCADEGGRLAGIFPLSYSAPAFGAAANEAIEEAIYAPRIIAGKTFPACQRVVVSYALR